MRTCKKKSLVVFKCNYHNQFVLAFKKFGNDAMRVIGLIQQAHHQNKFRLIWLVIKEISGREVAEAFQFTRRLNKMKKNIK